MCDRMEQLYLHWTDFLKFDIGGLFENLSVESKFDTDKRYFT